MSAGLIIPSRGKRESVNVEVKAEIRQMLTDILYDRVIHAEVVAAGPAAFREVFVRNMGGFFGKDRTSADHLANTVYQFAQAKWHERYPDMSATDFLDGVHVPSLQSAADCEREIDEAWTVEIAGDDRAMAQGYEGGARVRTGKYLGAKGEGGAPAIRVRTPTKTTH